MSPKQHQIKPEQEASPAKSQCDYQVPVAESSFQVSPTRLKDLVSQSRAEQAQLII